MLLYFKVSHIIMVFFYIYFEPNLVLSHDVGGARTKEQNFSSPQFNDISFSLL